MPKLIVLYPPPADAAAFERLYRLEHAPMVALGYMRCQARRCLLFEACEAL